MAEYINKTDTLNDGRVKLNAAIGDSNIAKGKAEQADVKSTQALANSESTQTQLDTIVIEGDSSVEAAQARVDELGEGHATLKARIDDGFEKTSSQLAETINIRNFGGAVNTDITQAFKDALTQAENLETDITIPSGTYYISGSLGEVIHAIAIKGKNVRLILTEDIPYLIRFMEQATLEGIEIDFGGHVCLNGYGIYFNYKPTIAKCEFKNLHGTSATQNQYFLEVNNNSERVDIENSVFYNVTNIGDGLSTNYGFTGFIFFRGVIPSSKKTIVNLVNNEFDKTKTIFPTGLSEQEKQNDQDADAIRVYGSGNSNHNKEQLEFNFRGNLFYRCQKRLYKINYATVFIDGDYGDNTENDILDNPPSHSFGQFRGCEVYVSNSEFKGRIRTDAFNLMESTLIRIVDSILTNTAPVGSTRVVGNNAPIPRPSVLIHNTTMDNFQTVVNHISSGVVETIELINIHVKNGKVLLRVDNELTNLVLKDILFEAYVANGTNSTRTLEYHNVQNEVLLDNVHIIEKEKRGGQYPHAVIIDSPTKANQLKLSGNDLGSMSRINIRSNDVVITNSFGKGFVYEVTDGTGCFLVNSIYEAHTSLGGLTTYGNTQVAPWFNV